jgi:hypothetical protein
MTYQLMIYRVEVQFAVAVAGYGYPELQRLSTFQETPVVRVFLDPLLLLRSLLHLRLAYANSMTKSKSNNQN